MPLTGIRNYAVRTVTVVILLYVLLPYLVQISTVNSYYHYLLLDCYINVQNFKKEMLFILFIQLYGNLIYIIHRTL